MSLKLETLYALILRMRSLAVSPVTCAGESGMIWPTMGSADGRPLVMMKYVNTAMVSRKLDSGPAATMAAFL